MRSFGVVIFLLLVFNRIQTQAESLHSLSLKFFGDTANLVFSAPKCFIDSTSSLDFTEVRNKNFDQPYSTFIKALKEKYDNNIFWMKFEIQNNSTRGRNLHVYCGSLDFVHLYIVRPDRSVTIISGGYLHAPVNDFSFEEKMAGTLPLSLLPKSKGEIFISFRQKTQEFDFEGLEIYDQNAFYSSFFKDIKDGHYFMVFQILFQGFMLCQLLFIFFQWFIIRRKEYFYYSLYLLVISLYFLSKYESLYGIELLFSRYPLLTVYLGKTLLIFPYWLYLRFVRSFLDIPQHYKTLNKWIVGLEHFLLVYAAIDLAFILTTFNQHMQTEIFMVAMLFVFVLSLSFIVYLFRKRKALIYYILAGSLCVALGNILGVVFTYVADQTAFQLGFHNILLFSQVGIILEISFFTAGLGYKSHLAEKEKIQNQKDLIEQLKANEILQSKMLNIRNKIAQDLHDDIGSTLSSISILSDLILKEKNGNSDIMIREIKDNSVILLDKIDDIIWSINPKNDSLERLFLRIRRFASSLFEARNIDYKILIQENIEKTKFPLEFRQHIYLILKESINNMVKYSQATQAIIEIGFDRQIFVLRVKDNGIGFKMSDDFEGDGIQSMKNRAALMNADLIFNTASGHGAEVLLRLNFS